MPETPDGPGSKPAFKVDPKAAAAIARFEAAQKNPSAKTATPAVSPRPKRKWRRLLWLALPLALLATTSWITGWGARDVYDKILNHQLAQVKQRKETDSIWQKLPAPRQPGDTETDSLRAPGSADPQFPDLAAAGAQAPVQSLAAFLITARSGDTIVLPPGRYTDCAVITQAMLTLRAAKAGTAILDGGACEQKAALVFRGGLLVVDGLMFRNMRVPDGNGAGIRLEQGALIVRNSLFYNNQSGILAAAGPENSLVVSNSRFVRNGSCRHAAGCAHSIYINTIKKFRIDNSRFEMASGGHFVKSRAARVDIRHSTFDDLSGNSSYLIDLPFGSNGVIQENYFHKGKFSRNRCCIIRIAAEGARHRSDALLIENNDARSDLPLTLFVRNDSTDAILLGQNRLAANVLSAWGPSHAP